jgi:hypothetical protein
MSTTLNNPAPTPTPAALTPVSVVSHSSDTIANRSITTTDKNRFATALSSVEQRSKSSGSMADPASLEYNPNEISDNRAGAQIHSENHNDPQHGNGSRDNPDDRTETADGSASVSTTPFNLAVSPAGMLVEGGFPVSAAGGNSTLHGALTASSVAALIERLEARALAAGTPMTFRVLDASTGITAIQLTQHANGSWLIRLSAERSARNHLKRHLSDLESGLAAQGHRVDHVDLLDASSSKDR